MDLAIITAQQVFILFILILAGYVCGKTGAIKIEYKKPLSDLLIYLVVPAMVINSYMREFDKSAFNNLLQAFALSFVMLIAGLIVTMAVTWKMKSSDKSIFRFACIFSNAAYMGFPLIRAMFGEEGILYASAFLTVYNILLWTVGYGMVSGKVHLREVIHSIVTCPVIIAVIIGLVIYIGGIGVNIPDVISTPVGNIGDMNTPVSMIITGLTIAGSDMKKLIRNKRLFGIIGLRMFVIPVICFALLYVFNIRGMVPMVIVVLEACPTAAITTMFAIQFKHNEDLAAGAVVFTTLISIVTLPLYTLLAAMI